MHFPSQLIYKLTLCTFLMLVAHSTAEVLDDEASLNDLYNNLLQREYPSPVVFPNHRFERKAQRSPSLRLRFGRRSDADVMPQSLEKRWFGDVDQKPIRSPSLRLRFGRRSDPSMPMHSAFDILMNGQQNVANNDDYNDVYDGFYNRVVRKPQRLRFGRSLPYQSLNNENQLDRDFGEEDNDVAMSNSENDFYNSMMHSQKLRNLLMSLNRQAAAGNEENEGVLSTGSSTGSGLEEDMDEFERAIRKPGPLRLRWGRSTGGKSSEGEKAKESLEGKNTVANISNSDSKSLTQQNKD